MKSDIETWFLSLGSAQKKLYKSKKFVGLSKITLFLTFNLTFNSTKILNHDVHPGTLGEWDSNFWTNGVRTFG